MDAPVLLRATGIAAGYGRFRALQAVDLELRRGWVTALVGPNGCGKTTFLRVLLALLSPQEGRIEWPEGRARIGYVPQADASEQIFPVSAREVVLMGLTPGLGLLRRPGQDQLRLCQEALEHFDVARLADRPFRSLSGGQRQRVMLARAIVAGPDLLVLDEPVRGLDFASAATLVASMRMLARERGMAIVVATHSLDLVANYADAVALFKDGRVIAGPTSQILDDAKLTEYLGTPIHVAEVDGVRVVIPADAITAGRPELYS
jgi:ABC-type Mn2+/Zn2+ transport system ATPase subunit